MGFKTDFRFAAATSARTSTATTLATLTIPAPGSGRIVVSGVNFYFGTAFTTPVTPTLKDGANTIWVWPNTLASFSTQFYIPVAITAGNALVAQSTVSAAGQTLDIILQYYIDN